MAHPMRTSNSGSAVGTRVPGGPSGNVETTWITKSPDSTRISTAWMAWSAVSPRFQLRRLASRSGVTPVAVEAGGSLVAVMVRASHGFAIPDVSSWHR